MITIYNHNHKFSILTLILHKPHAQKNYNHNKYIDAIVMLLYNINIKKK